MSGTLFVVATPIGNLDDITLRALRVLRESNVVAAEDTRRTAKLLSHHGIGTPTLSFHRHNAHARLPGLVSRLQTGHQVALVSDAGSPCVSDPGVELVQACVEREIPVDSIPGPCAPITAAIVSGFPLIPLTIMGFAPYRSSDRISWLTAINKVPNTICFFETPHRIGATLREMSHFLVNRPIIVGRELTKVHQELLRGTSSEILGRLTCRRGEFTVVVGPSLHDSVPEKAAADSAISREFGLMIDSGAQSRRLAVAAVAKKLGLPVKSVYSAVERHKKYGK